MREHRSAGPQPDDPAAIDLVASTVGGAGIAQCHRTYERIAPVYDWLDVIYERSWKARLRAELFAHAQGRLLDVGVGTGCNLPFYPKGAPVVGVDLSRAMLARAARRGRRAGIALQLAQMNLLDLAFDDHSFDTVAATFVLLCLPEPLQLAALRELARVCKPDGKILILDYQQPTSTAFRLLRRAQGPWLRWAFAGRYDARIEPWLGAAGLQVSVRRDYFMDAVTLLVLRP
jgi:ubiquinone/menaquinone biosynthesis C-methylase UbiE